MFKLRVVDVILQRFREPRKRIQVVAGPRQVGKTTSVEQALAEYGGGYTYKLAEGLSLSPLDWLISEWNAARAKAIPRQSRTTSGCWARRGSLPGWRNCMTSPCARGRPVQSLPSATTPCAPRCRRARPANCARIPCAGGMPSNQQ